MTAIALQIYFWDEITFFFYNSHLLNKQCMWTAAVFTLDSFGVSSHHIKDALTYLLLLFYTTSLHNVCS